ncbi:hypothetical protein HUT16_13070 [Kitasatospora sp. NA04385]|uniref:hypothetical protein n=1 Tax=Kitasatospora sp. NA04385 TaxID=2742135 RepID=UPI00159133D5|nr:hypothetical protein [Kitasatospora sp. NA04385]QKW19865.1 hypothetical protein HUT16_13070 [Kitasatospora sp. NA04385]
MRANRLLAVTVLSVLGMTGVVACDPEDDGSGDAAASVGASAPAAAKSPAGAPNGLEKLTVPEILTKAREVGSKLTSVKFTVAYESDGEKLSGTASADADGDCAGEFTRDGKGKVEVRRTGGKLYLKPDADFLNAFVPAKAATLKGKWLSDGSADGGRFGPMCDLGLSLQKTIGVQQDGTPDERGTKGDTKVLDGVKVVTVDLNEGQDGDTPEIASFSLEGKPYLLAVDGGAEASMGFSDFDKPVKVTAPPADQTVSGDGLLDG